MDLVDLNLDRLSKEIEYFGQEFEEQAARSNDNVLKAKRIPIFLQSARRTNHLNANATAWWQEHILVRPDIVQIGRTPPKHTSERLGTRWTRTRLLM